MVLAWVERLVFLVEKSYGSFERIWGEDVKEGRTLGWMRWRETGFDFWYFVGGFSNSMVGCW